MPTFIKISMLGWCLALAMGLMCPWCHVLHSVVESFMSHLFAIGVYEPLMIFPV